MPAKPKGAPDAFQDLAFPVRGLDVAHGYTQPPPLTTIQAVNVRTFEAQTRRGRGGSRPGQYKYIAGQVPSGPHLIQDLNIVVDPAAAALLDSGEDFGGAEGLTEVPGFPGWWVRTGGSGIQLNKNRKLTPLLIWNDPAPVDAGTVLGNTQLNAQAYEPRTLSPLPGSYAYSPPGGTVLHAGFHQPLSVVFTPTDALHYRTAKRTVHIDVGAKFTMAGAATAAFQATGIKFVQQASKLTAAGSGTLAFPSNVASGNCLLLYAVTSQGFGPAQTVTVSDTQGNTYTRLGGYVTDGFYHLSLWQAFANASGPCSITAAANASFVAEVGMGILEYSGVKPTGSLDGTAFNVVSSPGTSRTTTAVAISGAGELLIGGFMDDRAPFHAYTPDAGFISRIALLNPLGTSFNLNVLDQIGPPAAPLAVTGTADAGAAVYLALGASLKPA